MKDDHDPPGTIDVTKPPLSPQEKEKRFNTLRNIKDDLKGLYKPPKKLWDDSFIGEAISDNCHPGIPTFVIGGVGGVTTGLATGFFSTSRIPMPVRTPLPSQYFPRLQTFIRTSIIGSSVVWRIAKRTVLGTVLFAVLECDFKDMIKRHSQKYKGSILAGVTSGAIFGLRGGLAGVIAGMGIFAALPAGWELYLRKEQIRSRIFNP